jgi:carbon storage regulator
MLVLSRKQNEEIQIGNGIKVVVVDIGGGKVRIGIEAPKEVVVLRGELVDRDKQRPAA